LTTDVLQWSSRVRPPSKAIHRRRVKCIRLAVAPLVVWRLGAASVRFADHQETQAPRQRREVKQQADLEIQGEGAQPAAFDPRDED